MSQRKSAPAARPRPARKPQAARTGTPVEIAGRRLSLSNLDKVLYPQAGFTKGQVIDYYARIAPILLRHMRNRPLTLKRYPEGVEGEFFYEKMCPSHRPDWVATAEGPGRRGDQSVRYCVVNDVPTLVWVANLASIELHTLLSRVGAIDRPTFMVFDHDPGPGADLLDCIRVALRFREVLSSLGLQSLAKTSGGKGLHLYVPLNTKVSFEQTKEVSRALAQLLEREDPKRITSNMRKDLRPGRVFIDWSQNDEHKTTVCVYSLRARQRPTVSTPVTWEELEEASRRQDVSRLIFVTDAVLRRVERLGDLFRPVLELKQKLPKLDE